MTATSIVRAIAARSSGVTRADLVAYDGFDAATVDRAVPRLIARGLITERAQRPRMVGRVIHRQDPLLSVTVAGQSALRRRAAPDDRDRQPLDQASPIFGGGWYD